jgi:vanillate/4-hydroxybenzoate decarboxylase subunit D
MDKHSAPICPRCESSVTLVRFESPVPGVWTLYGCDACLFTWRSTEPATITDPRRYPARFKVKLEDLKHIPVMPAIAYPDD